MPKLGYNRQQDIYFVYIPKALSTFLKLEPGDEVEFEQYDELDDTYDKEDIVLKRVRR